jgi:hypothetical protein
VTNNIKTNTVPHPEVPRIVADICLVRVVAESEEIAEKIKKECGDLAKGFQIMPKESGTREAWKGQALCVITIAKADKQDVLDKISLI